MNFEDLDSSPAEFKEDEISRLEPYLRTSMDFSQHQASTRRIDFDIDDIIRGLKMNAQDASPQSSSFPARNVSVQVCDAETESQDESRCIPGSMEGGGSSLVASPPPCPPQVIPRVWMIEQDQSQNILQGLRPGAYSWQSFFPNDTDDVPMDQEDSNAVEPVPELPVTARVAMVAAPESSIPVTQSQNDTLNQRRNLENEPLMCLGRVAVALVLVAILVNITVFVLVH